MVYTKILRRIRENKTNYSRRKNMLMGHKDFVTVQISNENTYVQIRSEEHTSELQSRTNLVCRLLLEKKKKTQTQNKKKKTHTQHTPQLA